MIKEGKNTIIISNHYNISMYKKLSISEISPIFVHQKTRAM